MSKFWSGWREHRYGKKSAAYVPGAPRRIVNSQSREHLIIRTAEMLRDGVASPFEFEATCRHGIRSGFCLESVDWDTADASAALIVGEALKSIGAKRPTFEEGQPDATIPAECCAWCAGEIEQIGNRRDRFCSAECAKAYHRWREDKDGHRVSIMHVRARRVITREKQPDRRCKCCGESFKPSDPTRPSDFCSIACAKTIIPDRPCANCGTVFHPVSDKIRCCSRECRDEYARQPARASTCICCGRHYIASRAQRVAYCSDSCRAMDREFSRGWRPKTLTKLAFDHLVLVPANSRSWELTPVRFDHLVSAG